MTTIHIETRFNKDFIIQRDVYNPPNSLIKDIKEDIIRLKEEGIREALIKLGWTPPERNLKDHEIAILINDLKGIALEFHGHQCLRELISRKVISTIKRELI